MNRLPVVGIAVIFSLCGGISANAGPLPPCISATLSANGTALVVNDPTLGGREGDIPREVKTSRFRIYRSYRDLNHGLRVNGPERYWADPLWELVFTYGKSPFIACPYALVTDDAKYLVLIGDDIGRTALSIYRPDDGWRPPGSIGPPGGVLIREIPLTDLSPEIKVPDMITDHTEQWYSGGTFSFSADERTLIFTTAEGKKLQISLLTGDVQR